MRSLASRTAVEASAAKPSAPTASAYSCVTGAPPTITITSSRRPAFCSALMFALNIGIVVVRNAEKPTMSGWCSSIAAMNFSGATFTPRSITTKPAPSSMMLQRFLPMSWTVTLDGAHEERRERLGSGLGEQRAQDVQGALHRPRRDQHL